MQNLSKLYIGVILLCGLMMQFSACTEIVIDDTNNDRNISGRHGKINFVMKFDNFGDDEDISTRSAEELGPETLTVPLGDGLSMTATLKAVKADVGTRSAELRVFNPGARMYIVAYEQTGVNTYTYVHHVEFKTDMTSSLTPTITAVAGETPIELDPGSTYRFVACSLNDDTALPSYAASLTDIDPGFDLLWGESALIYITPGNYGPVDVPISMKHKFSKIRLSLTSEVPIPNSSSSAKSDITSLTDVKMLPDCKVVMTVDSGKTSFSGNASPPDFEQTFDFPLSSLPATSITSDYRIVFTDSVLPTIVKIGEITIGGKTYNDLFATFARRLRAGYEYDISMRFGDPKELTDDMPTTGFVPFVGAFWKNDQQGERLIRIARPVSTLADGIWTAVVVEGDSWITLDTQPSPDNGVWTSNGPTWSGNDPQFESLYAVSGGSMYVGGTLREAGSQGYQSGDEYIYFRIGLKSQQAPGTAPRYGMVLLTYANNTMRQRIWIRQGEEPDYLMRPGDPVSGGGIANRNKAVKFSPYNLTATLNAKADSALTFPPVNTAGFTPYPTQAGAFFQWANTGTGNNNRTRWVWPPNGLVSNWNATVPSGFWDNLSLVHETCPFGYRRVADGSTDIADGGPDMSLSELRQSLFMAPQAGTFSYTTGSNAMYNFLYGYYADGYFDRRQIVTSESSMTGSAVASATPQVAYQGVLFYNPDNFASLFFPAAGYRNASGASTGFGNTVRYWSATSPSTTNAYMLGGTYANMVNHISDPRSMALPIRCVNVPMFKAVPQNYEHNYLDPVSKTYKRYDSYLMDGSTHTIKVYSNTPWYIKTINDVDKSASTMFNPNPVHSSGPPKLILANQSGDNLIVGHSGTGLVSGETLSFTVSNDASFWGHLEIVFASPINAFEDDTIKVIFALPRVRLLSRGEGRWTFNAQSVAYQMLSDQNNFGTKPDSSVVYSRGFTITNSASYTLPTQTQADTVDIFVPTYNYVLMDATAQTFYNKFMQDGGVFLCYMENSQSNLQTYIRNIIPNTGTPITVTNANLNYGAHYIDSLVNDVITNGPFGDVRGKIWGDDNIGLFKVSNLPTTGVVTTYGIINDLKTNTAIDPNATFMFRSNTLPFLFCGDGGNLSFLANNTGEGPLALDANNRPIPKPYGNFNSSKGSGPIVVHNSALFGNIMLWAISQVDYSKKTWANR